MEEEDPDAQVLYIPVAGPFIAMGELDPEGPGRAALFVSGMAQSAGAAMFLAGLIAKESVYVRVGKAEVTLAPGVGGGMLVGHF